VSYELHITRAEEWTASNETPIPREDWHRVAKSTATLIEDGWVDWADIGSEPVFYLRSLEGPSLVWWSGEVTVTGSNADDLHDLTALAELMSARLVGDDGEEYADFDEPAG
jgi:hypothetical protein